MTHPTGGREAKGVILVPMLESAASIPKNAGGYGSSAFEEDLAFADDDSG